MTKNIRGVSRGLFWRICHPGGAAGQNRIKDWNRIAAGVQAFGFAKLKALRGYRDDPLKLRIAGSRDTVKSVFKKLASLISGG